MAETPTTEMIRARYKNSEGIFSGAEFDRWLRATLREAFQAGAESFIRIDWDGPDDSVRIERMWKHHEERICGNDPTP